MIDLSGSSFSFNLFSEPQKDDPVSRLFGTSSRSKSPQIDINLEMNKLLVEDQPGDCGHEDLEVIDLAKIKDLRTTIPSEGEKIKKKRPFIEEID